MVLTLYYVQVCYTCIVIACNYYWVCRLSNVFPSMTYTADTMVVVIMECLCRSRCQVASYYIIEWWHNWWHIWQSDRHRYRRRIWTLLILKNSHWNLDDCYACVVSNGIAVVWLYSEFAQALDKDLSYHCISVLSVCRWHCWIVRCRSVYNTNGIVLLAPSVAVLRSLLQDLNSSLIVLPVSNAMHGQNINLPVCVCVRVYVCPSHFLSTRLQVRPLDGFLH